MGSTTLALYISNCFRNIWVYSMGMYWATSMIDYQTGKTNVHMSISGSGSCPSAADETHLVYYPTYGDPVYFNNNKFELEVVRTDKNWSVIKITEREQEPEQELIMTKAQIISNHSDKLGYTVGDIIKSECVVKNIGGAGTVYLTVGLGYIDSSNMIFLTGTPTTDQLYLNFNQSYTFKEDVKVDITDYYRQQGIGWAYLQQQMYLFFLAGHKVNGDIVWDTERHIKIYLDESEGFKDPTSLPEVLPDIPDIPELPGLPGAGNIIDWTIDKLTPEPKPEGEESDLMPFLYIGFMGFIGYLLIRSQ